MIRVQYFRCFFSLSESRHGMDKDAIALSASANQEGGQGWPVHSV